MSRRDGNSKNDIVFNENMREGKYVAKSLDGQDILAAADTREQLESLLSERQLEYKQVVVAYVPGDDDLDEIPYPI